MFSYGPANILIIISSDSDTEGFSQFVGLMICRETVHLLMHSTKMRSEIRVFNTRFEFGAWRVGSVLKSPCCGCKGPGFNSQHHTGAHSLLGHQTDIHAGKTLILIK